MDNGNTKLVALLAHQINNRCYLSVLQNLKHLKRNCCLCDIMTCLSLPWALVKWNIDKWNGNRRGQLNTSLLPRIHRKTLPSVNLVLCRLFRLSLLMFLSDIHTKPAEKCWSWCAKTHSIKWAGSVIQRSAFLILMLTICLPNIEHS